MKKHKIIYLIFVFFFFLSFYSISHSFTSNYLLLEDLRVKYSFEKLKLFVKEENKGQKNLSVKEFIEKIKNPTEEYDSFMKKLLRSFFTGYGLRILVFLCIAMTIFFFFRTRNLALVLFFYVLGNIIMFFGHLIAKYLIK